MKRKSLFGILIVLSALILCAAPAFGDKGVPDTIQAAGDGLLEDVGWISLATSPECERYKPAVAWNRLHDEFLVVWQNMWPDGHLDIYARRVADDGELLSWFAVSAGPHNRLQPAVAYNPWEDEYLVVWMYNASGDGLTYEIWGRRIAWDGSYMGPEFQIITWENRTFRAPKVTCNEIQNQYFVVWTALDATTFVATDIAGKLVSADGDLLVGRIITTAPHVQQVDVTHEFWADEYLVVWTQEAEPGNSDIWASRLEPLNLGILTPGGFAISDSYRDEREPAVAGYWSDGYMVAWMWHYSPGDWDIAAQRLRWDGSKDGSMFFLAGSWDSEGSPDLSGFPYRKEYVAVYERTTEAGVAIEAAHWKGPGEIEWTTVKEAAEGWDLGNPAVAYGRPGFLIAYENKWTNPEFPRHIYGTKLVPHAIFLPLVVR